MLFYFLLLGYSNHKIQVQYIIQVLPQNTKMIFQEILPGFHPLWGDWGGGGYLWGHLPGIHFSVQVIVSINNIYIYRLQEDLFPIISRVFLNL